MMGKYGISIGVFLNGRWRWGHPMAETCDRDRDVGARRLLVMQGRWLHRYAHRQQCHGAGLEKIPISQGLVTRLHIYKVKPTPKMGADITVPMSPHRAPMSPLRALISLHRTANVPWSTSISRCFTSVSWCFMSVSRCLTMFYNV